MVTWTEIGTDIRSAWDEQLISASDHNIFQSFQWGEIKRQDGWEPLRLQCRDQGNTLLAQAQILVKSLPGFRFCWIPGGPALAFPGARGNTLTQLVQGLMETLKAKYRDVYVRFQSQGQTQPELSYYLSRACRRPTFRINSGFTTWIDLSAASADLISGMDGKHRYYTKKSRSFNIDWRCGADAELIRDLVELNREVVARKGVNWIATTEAEVQRMTAAVGNGALVLVGYVDGKPAAGCLALIFGRSAFYMIAASNEIGHKCHASYGLIERLWAELQARGVTNLDFGGLDPFVPGAAGVNHFKLGFGGPIVEYLGEWEWASKRWIGWLGNAGVRMRIKRV